MKGILADINVVGQVDHLVKLMQAEPWTEFWNDLGLVLRRFEDLGLPATAKDVEIWQQCQSHELILITDNRNDDSADSLTAAIRKFNTPTSLPVFTIADLGGWTAVDARFFQPETGVIPSIDRSLGLGR